MVMPRTPNTGNKPWTDLDDAPVLTEAFFARADVFDGPTLLRRGRPPSAAPKRQVTLRLDADVVERLRATGRGWQTRANAALKAWLARQGHRRAG
jgi:uncharacterized protein (DUF4415 family)